MIDLSTTIHKANYDVLSEYFKDNSATKRGNIAVGDDGILYTYQDSIIKTVLKTAAVVGLVALAIFTHPAVLVVIPILFLEYRSFTCENRKKTAETAHKTLYEMQLTAYEKNLDEAPFEKLRKQVSMEFGEASKSLNAIYQSKRFCIRTKKALTPTNIAKATIAASNALIGEQETAAIANMGQATVDTVTGKKPFRETISRFFTGLALLGSSILSDGASPLAKESMRVDKLARKEGE